MRRRIAETLALVLVPLLSGCGTSAGDEYIGEWSPEGARERLEITRQGESTFTVESIRKGRSRGRSAVATLNDDGILVMQVLGSSVALVIDEGSGLLTFDGREYMRFGRLFWAAEEGDVNLIRTLLEAGADVDAQCLVCSDFRRDRGVTALMIASRDGRTEAVEALLEAGADVDARDSAGFTALVHAARGGDAGSVRELLFGTRAGGDAETVEALLEAGADVDAQDSNGRSVLMWAATAGNAESVKALLEAGADVDAESSRGRTALMHAINDEVKSLLEGVDQ